MVTIEEVLQRANEAKTGSFSENMQIFWQKGKGKRKTKLMNDLQAMTDSQVVSPIFYLAKGKAK